MRVLFIEGTRDGSNLSTARRRISSTEEASFKFSPQAKEEI